MTGGNKKNELNQLNFPRFVFVDEERLVYISDTFKHRAMKWRRDAKEGTVMAGGNGEGGNLNQLYRPQGVIVDYLGQIYVADRGNDRIMRWCEGKGEVAVGGNGKENQLHSPRGLSFDDEKNFYAVDLGNNRIEMLSIPDNPQPLSKRKQKAKVKSDQKGKLIEKIDTIQTNIEPSCENSPCLEEEINWITISRKLSKHKSTPISSALINTK
ncbi:unnamed protein product [Adineta steineri]|uniref:Uncharacterized protein n=1 Tax=Adineta steineri TaxID=433720 RepID=A0A818Y8D5_9BILA|nr:unnamed protein product [Adineta steineri]CAF1338003.1 unnamed protein product [Adineta steineri]CAF3751026.1 unnamed protein product [Adineta steineri]CAF4042484.1 unnamed protein product [Adineta steineri]